MSVEDEVNPELNAEDVNAMIKLLGELVGEIKQSREDSERIRGEYAKVLSSDAQLNERVAGLEQQLNGLRVRVDSHTPSSDKRLVHDWQQRVPRNGVSFGHERREDDPYLFSLQIPVADYFSCRGGIISMGIVGLVVTFFLAVSIPYFKNLVYDPQEEDSLSFVSQDTTLNIRRPSESEQRLRPYTNVSSQINVTPQISVTSVSSSPLDGFSEGDDVSLSSLSGGESNFFDELCYETRSHHLNAVFPNAAVPKKTTCGFPEVRGTFRRRMPQNWSEYECRLPRRGELKSGVCFTQEKYSTRDIAHLHNIQYGCGGNEACCPPISYKTRRAGAP